MRFYKVPIVDPKNSIVWLEFQILLQRGLNPFSILYNKLLIEKYKRNLDDSERYEFGKRLYEKSRKGVVNNFFFNLFQDGYEVYVVTSMDKEILQGFLDSMLSELRSPKSNLYSSTSDRLFKINIYGSCSREMKAEIVKNLKNKGKFVIGFGASREDIEALAESDFGFFVSPFPQDKRFENLGRLEKANAMLHSLYWANLLVK